MNTTITRKMNFDQKLSIMKVGGPHVKGLIKQIRAENNTFESALADIIDNIYGKANLLTNESSVCCAETGEMEPISKCVLQFEPNEKTLYKM